MAFWTRRDATQFLVLEIGRLSVISITSPILYSPFSSCAWYLLDLPTILPYSSCLTRRSISTVTVFARLSLTTLPIKVRLRDFLASVIYRSLFGGLFGRLLLAKDGLGAGNGAARGAQRGRVV